jgi:hypothetical protein
MHSVASTLTLVPTLTLTPTPTLSPTLTLTLTLSSLGAHKTAETSVSLQARVDAFPDQSFVVTSTPMGKKLFCRCCPKDIENLLGTIKTHIGSKKHKDNVVKWFEKNKTDIEVKTFLHEYFKDHPAEEMASVGQEVTRVPP